MKSLALFVLLGLSLAPAFTQTGKTKTGTSAKKPTPKKSASPAKKTTPKSNETAIKKPAAKPAPRSTPKPRLSEAAEWEKASAIDDRTARIAALKKYIAAFPKGTHLNDAGTRLADDESVAADEALALGDNAAAIALYSAAVADAPKPLPEPLFAEKLSKLPATLYWKGERDAGLKLARALETKADSGQTLTIATFYMTVENGTEARRAAAASIASNPTGRAYQMLGLAERIDFDLEASAAAFARALELEPDSLDVRRGLAEAKRSLGRADEAAALYREILEKDAANAPARTGLILALFDGGKRADAETEMTSFLAGSPGNVTLLAGAAYWYAAHNEADKAVEYGRKAVDTEPRFIWGHIALARGQMLQKNNPEAERTLMAARRYGNFPTLEYEIAAARAMQGFYREAAEGLAATFKSRDGEVFVKLGGRIERGNKDISELISFERRASTFAPTAADDPAISAMLRSLLEFWQATEAEKPDAATASASAGAFTATGDPTFTVHRDLFAAGRLVAKNIAPDKALELTRNAAAGSDTAADVPDPTLAIVADELYAPRLLAFGRGETLRVNAVAKPTLLAVVRGRIEELAGAALSQQGKTDDAIIRLRRAIGVLPPDSVWLRSAYWRLGSVLEADKKLDDALLAYARGYKGGLPDGVKYAVIRSVYSRIKGSLAGLVDLIGPDPIPNRDGTVATAATPTPTPEPTFEPSATPTPELKVDATPTPAATVTPETKAETTPTPTPETVSQPTATPEPTIEATPGPTPIPTPEEKVEATPIPTPSPTATPEVKTGELFPPVVITIPRTEPKPTPEPSPAATPDVALAGPPRARVVEQPAVTPCKLSLSEESLSMPAGGELAVIIGTEDDRDLTGLTAESSSPKDVGVRSVPISGAQGRTLFIVKSLTDAAGLYQVTFKLSCGSKDIAVRVR